MQSPKISRVTKPHQSNKQSSLQQSQCCLKKTLVKKLWEYNIKCGSDVYLVIVDHMGDDVVQFFTTKFMVDQQLTEGFPLSEKSLTLSSRKANNIRKLPKARKVLKTYRTWLSQPTLPTNPCRVPETLCSELPVSATSRAAK
ncbi:hypothetical protein CIHG_05367 [Coccidioides immitis H538.4]|uniref:Uncharacterized protein n=2 Tax=Coccidioides immitis TaxID=5501 RepID=A0A0J8RUD9_COCIT|nr:hypothetical protein CIRG_02153 [Coccidioides immitis RMSCC 2394]KMU88196.1 hypothetical protein CIHG_05367 [Coccidioides immitis H538.4]TPX25222.1 hypothetical protein DIZ76_010672 [Coccidioides immitis]